jgi:WD40 repeat protein
MKAENTDFKNDYDGHRSSVIRVLYNSFLGHVITCDENVISAWDLNDGELVFKFSVPSGIVDACFDGEQRRIATTCGDGQVVLWNYLNGQQVKLCKGIVNEDLNSVVYIYRVTLGVNMVAAAGSNKTVFLWDDSDDSYELPVVRTMARLPLDVGRLCFVDPNTMIAGLDDGSLFALDFITGDIRMKLRVKPGIKYTDYDDLHGDGSNKSPVEDQLNFEANSKLFFEEIIAFKNMILITARGNGLVSFWDSTELKELYTFQGACNGDSVTSLGTNTTNTVLLTGDQKGYVTMFDTSKICNMKANNLNVSRYSFSIIRRIRMHTQSVSSICYIPGEDLWVSSSLDCTVVMFNNEGHFIGFFGQTRRWNLTDPSTFAVQGIGDLHALNLMDADTEEGDASDSEDYEDNESDEERPSRQDKKILPDLGSVVRALSPNLKQPKPPVEKMTPRTAAKYASAGAIYDHESKHNALRKMNSLIPSHPVKQEKKPSHFDPIRKSMTRSKLPPIKRTIFSKETRLNKVHEIESSLLTDIGSYLSSVGMDIDHLSGRINNDIYYRKDQELTTNILGKIRKDVTDRSSLQTKRQQHYHRNVLKRKISESDWVQSIHHLIEIDDDGALHKHFSTKDFDVEQMIKQENLQQQKAHQMHEKRKKQQEQSERNRQKVRSMNEYF